MYRSWEVRITAKRDGEILGITDEFFDVGVAMLDATTRWWGDDVTYEVEYL